MDNKLEIILTAKNVTDKAFARVKADVAGLGESLVSLNGVIAGVAGASGLGLLTTQSISATAEIERLANMAGVNVEAFQELSYAAGQYQITQDALTDGLKELSLRTDEYVVTGVGPAKEAFERLGYDQETLNAMLKDTPALLDDVIRRMEGLDTAAQIRIADEIFGGTGGEQFVAMIQGGAKALDQMKRSARDLGAVIDEDMVRNTVAAKKEVESLNKVLSAQFNTTVAALAPDIADVAESMADWVASNKVFISQDIPDYIGKTKDQLSNMLSAYNSIPSEITSAAGVGIVGSFLFGGSIGKVAGTLALVSNSLDSIGNNDLGGLVEKHYAAGNSILKLYKSIEDAATGKTDWWTGEVISPDIPGLPSTLKSSHGPGSEKTTLAGQVAGGEGRVGWVGFAGVDVGFQNLSAINMTDKERRMLGVSQDEIERTKAMLASLEQKALQSIDAIRYGHTNLTDKERRMMGISQEEVDRTKEALEELKESGSDYSKSMVDSLKIIEMSSQSVFKGMEDELVDFVTTGKFEFSSFADSVVSDLARIAIQQTITQPLGNAATSFLSNLIPSAHGNVLSGRGISALSNTIVGSPTLLPDTSVNAYATGTAMIGEAGWEGVVPLTRMPSGNLGVEASGGGVKIEHHFHNAPPVKDQKVSQGGMRIDTWFEDQMATKAGGNNAFTHILETRYGLTPALVGR